MYFENEKMYIYGNVSLKEGMWRSALGIHFKYKFVQGNAYRLFNTKRLEGDGGTHNIPP
jgi:hypothetical protein